jgi:hypothetical protein
MRTAPIEGRRAEEQQCDQEGTVSTPHRCRAQEVVFTARPRGTRWAVTAISKTGETVRLGIFPHRADALYAARLMAGIAGGRWLP